MYLTEEDESAFAEVYRAHHQKLLRYCQYRLRDRYEAEDVAQEAFARAWRSMPTSAYDRNFYPWLRVVAGNLCTDVLRKRSRSEPSDAIEIAGMDRDLDRVTDDVDRVLVRQALGRLNDRHRSALMMREDEGLTYDQIAARTGVTSGTVESLLWRARQALKREFTVLAGGEAVLGVVPLALLIVDRLRSGGRRAYLRVARRIPGLAAGDTPSGHVVLAAFAAITVATGVAATVGLSPSSGGTHGASHVATAAPLTAISPIATSAATTVPPTTATTVATSSPGSVAGSAGGDEATGPATSGSPSLGRAATPEVEPLVSSGAADNYYAHEAPESVSAGSLTVGVAPDVVSEYVNKAAATVENLVPSVAAPLSTKENGK